jgi:hypothetical protein
MISFLTPRIFNIPALLGWPRNSMDLTSSWERSHHVIADPGKLASRAPQIHACQSPSLQGRKKYVSASWKMIRGEAGELTTVDNRNRHEDASSAAQGTHQIGSNGEESKDSTASERSRWNRVFEFLVHATLTMARDYLTGETRY